MKKYVIPILNGWGECTLSSAGKEVLIKAVIHSILTYIMSSFLLRGYLVILIEAVPTSETILVGQ